MRLIHDLVVSALIVSWPALAATTIWTHQSRKDARYWQQFWRGRARHYKNIVHQQDVRANADQAEIRALKTKLDTIIDDNDAAFQQLLNERQSKMTWANAIADLAEGNRISRGEDQ